MAGAVAVTTIGGLVGLVVAMMTAHVTGTSLVMWSLAAGVLPFAAAAGRVIVNTRRPGVTTRSPRPRRDRVADWLAASAGAVVATCTFALASVLPGTSRVSWAMLGDSASQLVYARRILADGGLVPPPMPNPVPLAPALVAVAAAPLRPSHVLGSNETAEAALRHDLAAYAAVWAALIVVMCLLAGVLAHSLADTLGMDRSTTRRLAVAASSLLPLGWFWTGYPIKFGFINAQVALVILLAAVIAALSLHRSPVLVVCTLVAATGLLAITWTPLAAIPAVLAVAPVVQLAGRLRSAAPVWRAFAILAAMALMLVSWRFGSPLLADARASLSTPGGLAEFPKPMLPATAAMLVGLVLLTRQRRNRTLLNVTAGLTTGACVGLATVVWLSGSGRTWSYYPHKYAWICTALLLLATPVLGTAAVQRLRSSAARRAVGMAAVAGLAVSLGLGAQAAPGELRRLEDNLPRLMLVEDYLPNQSQSPDAVATEVVGRVDEERLTLPWRSSIANDYRITFWLLQLEIEDARQRGDWEAADQLWILANFHDNPQDLCTIAAITPEGLTVETRDGTLAATLTDLCPAADVLVEVSPGEQRES